MHQEHSSTSQHSARQSSAEGTSNTFAMEVPLQPHPSTKQGSRVQLEDPETQSPHPEASKEAQFSYRTQVW